MSSAARSGRQGRSRWAAGVLCSAVLVAGLLTGVAEGEGRARARGDARQSPGWEFLPLGPEGADLHAVVALEQGGWLTQAARGEIHLWTPSESQPLGGAWEPVALGAQGRAHLLAALPGGPGDNTELVLVLLSNGALLRWQGAAEGGTLRPWARLPVERAMGVIAMLRAAPRAAEEAGPLVLLAARDATFFAVARTGAVERWRAQFVEPARDPSATEDGPRTRLRWAGPHPSEPGAVLALTEWEGLFVSRDGARTFVPMGGGLPKGVRCLTALPQGGLCAACVEGMFRLEGGAWQPLGARDPERCRDLSEILAVAPGGARLLARTAEGRLLRSSDGGRSWTTLLANVPVRVRDLAFDPSQGRVLLATSRGALVSQDLGEAWEWLNRGLRQAVVEAIALGRDGTEIYLGTDLGFFTRGGEDQPWLPQIPLPDDRSRPEAAGPGEAECEGRPEAIWERLSGAIHAIDLSEDARGLRRLALGTDAGPAVCEWRPGATPAGRGWSAAGPARRTTAVSLMPDGRVWAAGGAGDELWAGLQSAAGVWSIDRLPDGVARRMGSDESPAGLATRAGDAQVLLAAGSAGLARLDGAGGPPPSAPPDVRVLAVAAGPGALWLGSDAGIWTGPDGRTWRRAGFAGERVTRVSMAAERPATIACHTSAGVYWSADGGSTWNSVPVPDQLHVRALQLDAGGAHLYLGTEHGLFRASLPVAESDAGLSGRERPILLEAHPNPFHGQVLLRGRLPAGHGRLVVPGAAEELGIWPSARNANVAPGLESSLPLLIVNVHGQLVRKIAPSGIGAGDGDEEYLDWSWDGRDERGQELPNGIYLLSARVGTSDYRGKVIKLR